MKDDSPFDPESLVQEIEMLLLPHLLEKEDGLDGSRTFISGEPGEVIVRLTGDHLIISEYAMTWESVAACVIHPKQFFAIEWTRLPRTELIPLLSQMIDIVRKIRLSKFIKCEWCKEPTPPE